MGDRLQKDKRKIERDINGEVMSHKGDRHMNEWWDERETDQQSNSQTVKQTDPEEAAHTLGVWHRAGSWAAGNPGFCTTAWRETLCFRKLQFQL